MAKGFSIETPDANLIDQGTSFGVSVTQEGIGSLQVFDGLVDVEHRQSGKQVSVRERQAVEITRDQLNWIEERSEYGKEQYRRSQPTTRRQLQITTAIGTGRDHWIIRDETERYGPSDLLMIKWAQNGWEQYDRKIYLKFDLTEVDVHNVSEAVFSMTATATQLGFASRMPEATFAVYALTDDSQDDWQPNEMRWENAPANVEPADRLDITQVQLTGRFQVPHGQKYGAFSINTKALLDVVHEDTNQIITLIVVPETREEISDALVHGFASGSHETLSPPTLRLTLDD